MYNPCIIQWNLPFSSWMELSQYILNQYEFIPQSHPNIAIAML